ncbi:MAG: hypothetical protein J6L89_08925 [Clostridia bacterium]|nr:hypothetical protein [Clostridia bacterium]
MKYKSPYTKTLALLLSVISMIFIFTSCTNKAEPPEDKAFSLVMDFSPTTVQVGKKITFKAILKNSEHESFTLEHPAELIHISVVKAEDYKQADIPLLTDTVLSESNIAPHGQIEEFYDFKPTEKGEYILKAYTVFSIEGKETTKDYFYECDEITITVK